MRYFPVVAMAVVAVCFTTYLLSLEDHPSYQFDLISILVIMSPVVLVSGLIWIIKFPDTFARCIGKIIEIFQRKKSS